MILVRLSCIESTRCKCDFSKEYFLDQTALNDGIVNIVGLEMISINHHRQISNDIYKDWYGITTQVPEAPTTTYSG